MSESTVENIIMRIKDASPLSPIAVFRVDKPKKYRLNAVFAATIKTAFRINSPIEQNLIGVFDKRNSLKDVRDTLRRALNNG